MIEQLMTKHTAHSLYRYTISSLSVHLFVDGHIGCFFVLVTANNSTLNIGVYLLN